MRSSKTSTAFGIVMIAGSIPCTLAILFFFQLIAARDAGHPASGDGIGLMMMSLMAYAIALLSFVSGSVYFGFAVFKRKHVLRTWHWFGIGYSLSQVTIPIVYFSTR